MRILGIDTATPVGSVGAAENGGVVAERFAHAADGHGSVLAPLVERVLADAGWRIDDLDAVAISIGPGSFTGLRIGLGLAKGMAYAARLPLIPVPTLDALATVAAAQPGEMVCPMLDARKGEVYAALYAATDDGVLHARMPPMLGRPADLLARIEGRCRFLGDAVDLHGVEIAETLGPRAVVLPFMRFHPRGGAVARFGARLAPVAGPEALASLEPFYIRSAYVQVHREGRAR